MAVMTSYADERKHSLLTQTEYKFGEPPGCVLFHPACLQGSGIMALVITAYASYSIRSAISRATGMRVHPDPNVSLIHAFMRAV